ncbi:MAG: hypothetical protein CTY22_10905 [Methylomonas sp.]|nr:MAG: hypothetical protein CTY23_11015 [Methylomonas sp.]PPD24694.1 MAG: hypothetical protein CTY22_10905 [Methylomonas sp.]PPD39805.1 MAG: hypothetical protein CTY17_07495 [Methylomonas sp.]PPD51375.1 MAG: hypothetical protein CTY11_12285 [Methylomonas sp.]
MNKWIRIAMVLSLSGCAAFTPEEPHEPEEAAVLSRQEVDLSRSLDSAIDEEVLYLLVAAEIAGQRSQYDLALDAYLQAAKRVDDARVAERAVKIGLFLKDEKRTQEALAIWLSKEPDNLAARKFAALLAIKSGDHAAAVENLDAVLSEDPAGFEGGMLEIVKALEKEGRVPFIYDVLEDLSQRHPDQVGVLFVQGVIAMLLQNNEQAQQKVSRVLEIQPDWSKALVLQAQLAAMMGDMTKSRGFLERAIKQAPGDRQLRKTLLEVLVNDGAYDEAIRLCHAVLEETPGDGETLFSLALIHLRQNQTDKAENYFEKALRDPDWEGRSSFYLGRLALERKANDKALMWFDRAEEAGHGIEAGMAAVSLMLNEKRYDETEARLSRLLSKFPDQKLRLLMAKAELFNQTSRFQDAFAVLTLALKDAPESRDVLYARALIAERLDKIDVVEADLRKILDKNPDDVGALNALGYSLVVHTQRFDEAEKYLLKALSIQPDEAVILDSYGWLLFKRGRLDEALVYLQRAYEKQPENEIAAHIAEIMWVKGDSEGAKKFFEDVFKRSPDDEYLLEFKRRFLIEPK